MKPLYWTGHNPLNKKRKTVEDLQFFLDFASADWESTESETFLEAWNKMLAGPLEVLNLEGGEEEDLVPELQGHLRERIGRIMAKRFWSDWLFSIEVRGTLEIGVYPRGGPGPDQEADDRFVESFTAHVSPEKNLQENAKTLLDLWLVDLIRELGLQPSRFSTCAKCGKFFYQPTSRAKIFCSKQCAGAVRQARYEKRKHGKKE